MSVLPALQSISSLSCLVRNATRSVVPLNFAIQHPIGRASSPAILFLVLISQIQNRCEDLLSRSKVDAIWQCLSVAAGGLANARESCRPKHSEREKERKENACGNRSINATCSSAMSSENRWSVDGSTLTSTKSARLFLSPVNIFLSSARRKEVAR